MSGALHGIRVIDFGQYLAGRTDLAALLLANDGANKTTTAPSHGRSLKPLN
jgi:crotonobetainyl-CoA:carnitine CoA-transferase CaiB-like acyl-CoA transferase